MKKKFLPLFALALAMLLSLAACGGSAGGGDNGAPASNVSSSQSAPSVKEEYGEISTDAIAPDLPMDAAWGGAEEDSGGSIFAGVPENAKMIYTADINLETKEFDAASQALAGAVAEMGGYFESRSVSEGGRYRSMDCVVRIPAEHFTALLDRAGEVAHTTYRHEYSDNVSEAYYDSEARLTTQRTKLARLQELLSQAEDMADIITIESAISETELQIEYLTGTLRQYDSQIDYSTVNLSLYEVYRLSTDEEVPVTFGDRFGSALVTGLQRGIDGLEDFAITVARNWMTLLILAAVIVCAALFLRRRSKRRAAQRIAAALPREPEKTSEEKPAGPEDPEKK